MPRIGVREGRIWTKRGAAHDSCADAERPRVMDRPERRSTEVQEAALEQPPLMTADSAADDFDALYRRTFPHVYAYVASLLRDRSAVKSDWLRQCSGRRIR